MEEAVESLNSLNISYQVVYQEDDGEENIVLKQNIRSGKVIDNTESITLTVSQKKKYFLMRKILLRMILILLTIILLIIKLIVALIIQKKVTKILNH